jgi:hypothetical protein
MPEGQVNFLMRLWEQSLEKHNDTGPFESNEHMHAVIDGIKHGDAPWRRFVTSYNGEKGPGCSSWKRAEYEVVYRDPDVVIRNLLANPDFDGHFDYAPYVQLDSNGNRKWDNYMSGNFAWRHAVRDML